MYSKNFSKEKKNYLKIKTRKILNQRWIILEKRRIPIEKGTNETWRIPLFFIYSIFYFPFKFFSSFLLRIPSNQATRTLNRIGFRRAKSLLNIFLWMFHKTTRSINVSWKLKGLTFFVIWCFINKFYCPYFLNQDP